MRLLLLLIGFLACSSPALAQDTSAAAETVETDTSQIGGDAPSVFIDCKTWGCDFDYFRREINFVSYVRNRQDADVHVLITAQQAGGGGRTFTLDFIGLRQFGGEETTLTYTSGSTATDDEVRQGLARRIKAGLLGYVAETSVLDQIDITYRGSDEPAATTPVEDPWNLWVFEVGLRGEVQGEQRTSSQAAELSFSADRTSATWKVDWRAEWEYDKRRFEVDDGTVTDIRHNGDFDALVVRSISEHWSVGNFASVARSTFNNYDMRFNVAPALEYNLFPYSESSRKQLLFLYRVGVNIADYREETIFNRMSQTLMRQALNITMDIQQPWGEIRASVEGSHYLHDFDRKRLSMFNLLGLNVYRGLSINLFGRLALIRDQLNLPAGDASREDVLLERRELATSFDYSLSVGLSYTFGATTNNIVNPRFGD